MRHYMLRLMLEWPSAMCVMRAVEHHLQFVDVAKMLSRFPMESFGRGVWIFSQSALPQVLIMKDKAGNSVCQYGLLLGFPTLFSDDLPNCGHKGDACLIDSKHLFDGNLDSVRLITLADGTTQVSSLVILH